VAFVVCYTDCATVAFVVCYTDCATVDFVVCCTDCATVAFVACYTDCATVAFVVWTVLIFKGFPSVQLPCARMETTEKLNMQM
jgi:hypothetical protein